MPATGNPDGTLRPESPPEPAAEAASKKLRPLMRLQLPADPVAPSVARTQVRRWLTALAWPTGHQFDVILLAVSEAVSNAAEHAYRDRAPGMIEISGTVEIAPSGERGVALTVRDHGHWRPPPRDEDGQRRGIPLMRACMESVTIGPPADDRAGTQVVLRSRTVPAVNG
jgi:anti-sigma regulatory factor (Ser/Thr protein kinase)